MPTEKVCPFCQKTFIPKCVHQIYCNASCRTKLKYRNNKRKRQLQVSIERAIRKKRRRGLSIEEINRAALQEGISYGKYVLKYGL